MANIKIFEGIKIRTEWDTEKEDWLFSVVDICEVLSESTSKRKGNYWNVLKNRLKKEGSQLLTI